MMTDPVADMLTRIRNAGTAGAREIRCPSSRLKHSVAKVLEDGGYVSAVRVEDEGGKPKLVIGIRFNDDGDPLIEGIRRVSRPSRRIYVGKAGVPKVRNGLGMAVISTSRGVLSDDGAREAEVGGEVLCEVW